MVFAMVIAMCRPGISQTSETNRVDKLLRTVKQNHFSPREIDDRFSELIFDELMPSLDPEGLIFSSEEMEDLKTYRHSIDDQLREHSTQFIDKVGQLYDQKLSATETVINDLFSTKLDFSKLDTLVFNEDAEHVSEKERVKKWHQFIKLQILWDAAYRSGEEGDITTLTADSLKALQQQTIKREQCHLNAFRESGIDLKQYVFDSYLRAIANAFDPHTMYFNANDEAEFTTLISKEAPSYGFDIDKNGDGEVEIGMIVPGSPAWNSSELNEGDVILGVEANGKPGVDFDCISLDEAASYMQQANVNEVSFRVRKQSGEITTVKLTKEMVTVQENVIESHILNGEKRIAYMYLPSFYSVEDARFEIPNGCANDIAKELLRLEREKIDGLILDLRDNGGGSMLEALRLAGIFIDWGALSVAKYKGMEPETLKDLSRGMAYSGPLVVMVNEGSASASELFSASMQDHNRAVIVGSRTYGKSTIQEVMPLSMDEEGTEFVKMTIGQFYRVTGESLQKTGVIPDVELPSEFAGMEVGERFSPSCLDAVKIDKKTYYTPQKQAPVEELKKRSASRVAADSTFKEILSDTYNPKKDYLIPLDLKGFQKYFNELYENDSDMDADSIPPVSNLFRVEIPSYRNLNLETETVVAELDAISAEMIGEDIYVSEAYNIIKDLIELTSNK